MSKFFLISTLAILLTTLLLVTACAEEDSDTEVVSSDRLATAPAAIEPLVESGGDPESIMDRPVDFSSAENAEKTLQAIRQQAGENEAGSFDSAISYLMVYDLSVKRDKDKLYQKLNGKTPNEIIASTRR